MSSEKVNTMSPLAQLFFYKLISVVDDYGRFDARPTILRSSCWPLDCEKLTDEEVSQWLSECARDDGHGVCLVTVYEFRGKPYLQINDFRQRTRSESKWPEPSAPSNRHGGSHGDRRNDRHGDRHAAAHARGRSESESEAKTESETKAETCCAAVPGGEPSSGGSTAAQGQSNRGRNAGAESPGSNPGPEINPGEEPDRTALAWRLVDELMGSHPRSCSRQYARSACEQEIATSAKPAVWFENTRNSHAEWLAYWERERKNNPRLFVPTLDRWFLDGDYARQPPKAVTTARSGGAEMLDRLAGGG